MPMKLRLSKGSTLVQRTSKTKKSRLKCPNARAALPTDRQCCSMNSSLTTQIKFRALILARCRSSSKKCQSLEALCASAITFLTKSVEQRRPMCAQTQKVKVNGKAFSPCRQRPKKCGREGLKCGALRSKHGLTR